MSAKKGKKFFKKTKPEVGNNSVNLREKNMPQKVAASVKVKTNTVEEQGTVPKKRPFFPSIFRTITEKTPEKPQSQPAQPPKEVNKSTKAKSAFFWKLIIASLLIVLGIEVNFILGASFYKNASSYIQLALKRNALINEINLWQNISQKYPDYRDAYVQGAIIAYELGDKNRETYFLNQLKLIDPNYPWIKTFEQLQKIQ